MGKKSKKRRRLNLKKRSCPTCAGDVVWMREEGKKNSSHIVVCKNGSHCGWKGPFYDSLPPIKRTKDKKNQADFMMKLLQRAFNFESDGTITLEEFEQYLLTHPYGDPDDQGNAEIRGYFNKLAQIQFLSGLASNMDDIDEDHKRRIIENEIDRLFRKPQALFPIVKK